ncbi:cell wall protein DAN4-like isoform X2 [Colossoma macropomum]|uniref:cell wall protein DAN4-like isoform X2 n=1 Tax=Colossoma macropomum TaxID=42526 RepID=UPI001864852F|nr:cell wall protein DAN4-like isoform X2 [Colossoma macropomum]
MMSAFMFWLLCFIVCLAEDPSTKNQPPVTPNFTTQSTSSSKTTTVTKPTSSASSETALSITPSLTPNFTTQSISSSETATVTEPTSSASSGTTLSNTLSLTPPLTTQSTSSCGWSDQSSTSPPVMKTTTVMQPTSSASRGTTLSNTSYNLTYIDDPKTWIAALQYCQNHHKTLVHIVNSTVQEFVTQMLQNKIYPNGVWIGLERNMLFMCAPWMWTGGPYVNYSEWHSSFPVDPTSQYCGKLVNNGSKWLDACCSEELPFICQLSLNT